MIELSDGTRFDPYSPELDVEVVAHSLSMQCRWTGHCRHFYSVAEHSILVSLLMEKLDLGDPLEGLFHDEEEVAYGDLASPWKRMWPWWKDHTQPIDSRIRVARGLPPSKTEGCDWADQLAQCIEARLLMTSRGEWWPDGEQPVLREADRMIAEGWRTLNLYPPEAKAAFIKRYNDLAT